MLHSYQSLRVTVYIYHYIFEESTFYTPLLNEPHYKEALVIRFATRSPYAIVHMILQLPGDLLLRLFGDSINGLTELQELR